MKRKLLAALILIMVGVFAGGYWWRSQSSQPDSDSDAAGQAEPAQTPVASVQVEPIQEGALAQEIAVYGTIVPAAGATQTITVPYESRIRRILVSENQQVARGDPLLEVAPSPETRLQTQQARNDYDTAQKALQFMQQRFELKLATNDQLLQAKQAVEQARAKLESMRRRGSDAPRTLNAEAPSVVSKVSVQAGAIVPAGNAMIELVMQNRLEARLGIQPVDRNKVKAGQKVSLARVNEPGGVVVGKIRKLSQAANATSHLIDAFVEFPSSAGFLLNEYVAGRIVLASVHGLIVPRSAILPEGDHQVLFTVKAGHARIHPVQILTESANRVQIGGKDLQAGEPVVTLGNYELKDGMAVKVDRSR